MGDVWCWENSQISSVCPGPKEKALVVLVYRLHFLWFGRRVSAEFRALVFSLASLSFFLFQPAVQNVILPRLYKQKALSVPRRIWPPLPPGLTSYIATTNHCIYIPFHRHTGGQKDTFIPSLVLVTGLPWQTASQ